MQDLYLQFKIEETRIENPFWKLEGNPWMEESASMDNILCIRQTLMIFYEELDLPQTS